MTKRAEELEKLAWTAVGNEELGAPAKGGDRIICPHCGEEHELEGGINAKTGQYTETLLVYSCGDRSVLAAIYNKLLPGVVLAEVKDVSIDK
jgi:hypothetical protein